MCSVDKVFEIEKHVGTAVSGLIADARTLVEHARVQVLNHHFTFDEPMPVRRAAAFSIPFVTFVTRFVSLHSRSLNLSESLSVSIFVRCCV